MGKIRAWFTKGVTFFILSIFLILSSGCETAKGAFQGAFQGAKKDLQSVKKADDWMRNNLW